MPNRTLQLTFVGGRPVGAYLYLPEDQRPRVARTEERARDIIVDFSEDDIPIGVEIISFGTEIPARLNAVLLGLGIPPLSEDEQRPLRVA